MKIFNRNVAGHFCDSEKCHFFLHTDIVDDDVDDNETVFSDNTKYCISLVGEYGDRDNWKWLNASGLTYEIIVFDKRSESPWSEIESARIDDKVEATIKHAELVQKYLEISKNENQISV